MGMHCPHQDFGVCDNCWARQRADDRLADRLDHDARARQRAADDQALADRLRRLDDEEAERWRRDGERQAQARAARREARSASAYGLFWHQRLLVAAVVVLSLLMVLTQMPDWVVLVVVAAVGLTVRRVGTRPFRRVLRALVNFVLGQPLRG